MPTAHDLLAFGLVCLVLACTPGPNMIYLISRSIAQGPRAGLISLLGVGVGFGVYMLAAVLGLTALLISVPLAYEGLRIAGIGYLLFLAWQLVRPGGRSRLSPVGLEPDGAGRLFAKGLLTNLLNPKAAILYLSLLPQFIRPDAGSPLGQGLALGLMQIVISMSVNGAVLILAGKFAETFAGRPRWHVAQRWLAATVLGGFAVRLATDARR